MTPADRQMLLFADLPIPAATPAPLKPRPQRPWKIAVQALACLLQLPIRAPLRDLDRDDIPEPGPVHRIVKAADAEPLKVIPVSSIFGLAATVRSMKAGRFSAPERSDLPPLLVQRDYATGSVRVIRQRPEDTAEWQEKERARRAKQRPPKPTRKAKTRSKKLLELIGEPDD